MISDTKIDGAEDTEAAQPQPYIPDDFAKQEFVRHREYVWDLRKSNFAGYDNCMLTISAASLAFSLTYIKDIVNTGPPQYPLLVKLSWLFLTLSIVVTLFAFSVGVKACDADVDVYREFYYHNNSISNPWSRRLQLMHGVAGTAFVCGITLSILFAVLNFGGTNPVVKSIVSKRDANGGKQNHGGDNKELSGRRTTIRGAKRDERRP